MAEDTTPNEPAADAGSTDLPPAIDWTIFSATQLVDLVELARAEHAELSAIPDADRTIAQWRRIDTLQRDCAEVRALVGSVPAVAPIEPLATIEVPAAAATVDPESQVAIDALPNPDGVSIAELALAADRAATNPSHRSAPRSLPARPAQRMYAGTGQNGQAAGAEVDMRGVGEMMQAIQRSGSRNEAAVELVKFAGDAGPAALRVGDPIGNTQRLIEAFSSEETRTAAAVCGPPEPLRDVQSSAYRGTPVFDSFGSPLRSERGRFDFLASPGLGTTAVSTSTQVWTDTNQAAIVEGTVATWKPLPLDASCGVQSCYAEAVPAGIAVKKIDELTSPEYVAALLDAVGAAQDRAVESYILARIDATSLLYTAGNTQYGISGGLGARVPVTDILSRLLAAFAATNRAVPERDLNYRVIVPAGFVSHIMLDEVARLSDNDEQAIGERMFAEIGINGITITPDWSSADSGGPFAGFLPLPANATTTTVPARPLAWTLRLVDNSAYFPFQVDEEAISMVPDLTDRRKNRVSFFGERWVGLCKRLTGVPTARIDFASLDASGVRAAGVAVTQN